ncbi:MAG: hypothetical protein ACTSSC_08305, partial [Promethearchaeota archaeon]
MKITKTMYNNANRISYLFSLNSNSKRQKVFEFLAEYPHATNQLLYNQFGARTRNQKASIR